MIGKPEPDEYPEFFQGYIELVVSADIIGFLEKQNKDFVNQLLRVGPDKAYFRYAPDKWSIKEVLGHVIDIERAMAYRAFSFSRGEDQALPGIDQDQYTLKGDFDYRNFHDLIQEFKFLRLSNIRLFGGLNEEAFKRKGTADQKTFTVRALIFIAAGHLEHHRQVLRGKYGVS